MGVSLENAKNEQTERKQPTRLRAKRMLACARHLSRYVLAMIHSVQVREKFARCVRDAACKCLYELGLDMAKVRVGIGKKPQFYGRCSYAWYGLGGDG
eukprot:6214714-Pleurochrysis_carterae.AAC.4